MRYYSGALRRHRSSSSLTGGNFDSIQKVTPIIFFNVFKKKKKFSIRNFMLNKESNARRMNRNQYISSEWKEEEENNLINLVCNKSDEWYTLKPFKIVDVLFKCDDQFCFYPWFKYNNSRARRTTRNYETFIYSYRVIFVSCHLILAQLV